MWAHPHDSTVAIASESLHGGIGVEDYFDVGGGESAHIAFDPNDPTLIDISPGAIGNADLGSFEDTFNGYKSFPMRNYLSVHTGVIEHLIPLPIGQ